MENSQLQHLGRLLVSGEDNALLARELMIGQGIWNMNGVCAFSDIPKMRYFNFRPKLIYQLETSVTRTPRMLPHHIPTLPTTPEQITASGPSGS